MKIYKISFDYNFALADITESYNGIDSLDFSQENPKLFGDFKYSWINKDSDRIPDFVLIMSSVMGCKTNISQIIKDMFPNIIMNSIKINQDSYMLFSNIPLLSDCLNLRKSKFNKFSNGDIMEILIPVFLPNKYPPLFKITDMPSSNFCNDEFVKLINSHNYNGLIFEEVKIKSKLF